MNRFLVICFLIIGTASMKSQIHEIGLFLGGSNYIGDIGPTDYIAPTEPAIGIVYKWNKSPRHSWRASYTQSKITSNDKDADSQGRQLRGYNFENSLKEISLGLEFDFFDFNLHDEKPKFTPYIYSGLSYVRYNALYFFDGRARYNESQGSFAIPIVLGLKTKIVGHMVLSLEAGARTTFKDDIDGSNPSAKNLEPLQFGNINSTDWYVFTGFTLTYTFGNKPCYCVD